MSMRTPLAWLAALLLASSPAAAQEACKTLKVGKPLLLADMYRMAEERAKAWKPDATFTSMSTTTLGLLKPDGTAASWHVVFASPSAGTHVSIDTNDGMLTCWASPGKGGRAADLAPGFFRDGAALYAIARQQGEALIAQGYGIMLGTAAAPGTRRATWNINYHKDGAKDGGLLVIVDANTGKVEKVIR
jgi:hypothetical protein